MTQQKITPAELERARGILGTIAASYDHTVVGQAGLRSSRM
jgi:hypothetical protein